MKRGARLKTFTLVATETVIIFSVVLLGLYVRFSSRMGSVLIDQRGLYKIAFTTFICQLIFYFFELYDISTTRTRRELFMHTLRAVGVVCLVLGGIFLLRPTLLLGYLESSDTGQVVRYANGVMLMAVILALALMVCWRIVIHWLLRHPWFSERIVIVGTGAAAVDLAREVTSRRDLGYHVVGFVAEDPALVGQSLFNPSVVGIVSELGQIVSRDRVARVVVALQDRRGHLPVDQLLDLRLQGTVAIEEGTSLYERVTGKISVEMLRPSWIIFSGGNRRGRLELGVRRAINIVGSLIAMIASIPIALLTVLAIKLDSKGPVFYTQERVGKNNRPFTIIKFRSMRVDAEQDGPVWAQSGDERITRVGRIIRKIRVDEIPQFFNILRGDMSFVGPRAERPFFVEQLTREVPFYSQRHLVEPGLTGWAQVNYGYGSTVEDAVQKLQYDLYYIKNETLLLDLWVILKSLKIVFIGRGR
jgi:sugar transferase (PEP-CTERM system associated)